MFFDFQMVLPKPAFEVVHLEKLHDEDNKLVMPEYINALLLKLIRLKAFPTFNQENSYMPGYLQNVEGFLLVNDGYNYFLINPAEYEGQRLSCIISFQETLDSLQKSKYRDLLLSLFCLQPQTLVNEEEDRETWKKIFAKNMCDVI